MTSEDTIRAGVIGCGLQGRSHLDAFAAIEGIEVVAIADLDESRLAEVGAHYDVAHRYTDGARLLEHDLDLVSVCTMPNTHRELTIAALERGAHVVCEKPMARSAEEAADMVRAAERAGRLLIVGFNMRYMGATTAVRQFMDDGLLGDLICTHGHMLNGDLPWWGKHHVRALSGGGTLASASVHMVDLMMWLAGNPRPLTATASMATVVPHKRAHSAPEGALAEHDVEDIAFGHVRFEGGFWFSLESVWVYDRPGMNYSFDALGTRGQAHLDPLELLTERDGAVVRVREDAPTEPDWIGSFTSELSDVLQAVRTGRVPERLATGRQALAVQAVVDALYRSARESREVAVEVPDV